MNKKKKKEQKNKELWAYAKLGKLYVMFMTYGR